MTVSEALRERIEQQAKKRCGYCQIPSQYVYAVMEIDHIIPKAAGGTDDEDNLWLACPLCNGFKGILTEDVDRITNQRVRLFNPRRQRWTEHFRWASDGARIVGRTACGRVTVRALRLNFKPTLEYRLFLVKLGVYPPDL
jgi:hypothetical protein